MYTQTQLAYLAGIVDGEGSLCIYRGGKRPRIDYASRLLVVSTDRVLIDWLLEHFGGLSYTRKPAKEGWKTKYEWIAERSQCIEIAEAILPYLVIKSENARLLIRFQQSFNITPRPFRIPEEVRVFREACYLQMKILNHRNDLAAKEPS